jgi:ABC-2 type transport system permease protein
MWKFIKHEWKYWLKSPMTWIFFAINTLLIMGAVSSDSINIGGGVGSVHKNAPFVIQSYYGVMSLIGLLMTTAFMNAAANRDFENNMYQFVFSSPIKKRDYYFGKFIGAATMAVIPLLGVSLGVLIGPLMPWTEPERYGEVIWSGHINGLIGFGIPNTIIVSVLLYVLAIIFRSNIVSFVGAMLILVFYAVSSGFTRDIEKEWLANLLDPFGFRPENILAKYMTVDEKNLHGVPISGAFLFNRIIWLCISIAILGVSYFKFSFTVKNKKGKKEKENVEKTALVKLSTLSFNPSHANVFSFSSLVYLIKFETKAIIKNPTFIIIVIIGLINLIASLTSFSGTYGTDQYPVTYDVIDTIKGAFYLFIIAIITFYSGVLVWKERDAKINEINDATPVKTGLLFSSKLFAMVISISLILVCAILIGIIAQLGFGYTRFQLDVYFKSLLVLDLLSFSFLVVISLLFHYLINNRYIAYFAFVAFAILNQFIWGVFKINTNMVKFGGTPDVIYSDMNGFGPFVTSSVWFNLYWIIASLLIGFIIYAFYLRGKETQFKGRLKTAKFLLLKNKLPITVCIIVFILCGSFVFYNTKILNTYDSEKEQEDKQVEYEKNYKKYENLNQPRFYKFNYVIDIFPEQRSLKATINAWAKNTNKLPISELHFTLPQIPDSVSIDINNSKVKLYDKRLGYRIYSLNKQLQPNDSILVVVKVSRETKGFENEVTFTQLTQNGTFFNNGDIVPNFGYSSNYEIFDKNTRAKLKLPKRKRSKLLNEEDIKSRSNSYISNDADWVDVTTTISTSKNQTAIAPGSLVKTWEANNRRYFTYQLDHQSLNFYSFISANYEVARKKWNGIDLEVYYDKQHAYNVSNMLKSLEKSLDYYTKNFGKYYHKQCRIIEFPRYSSSAQAFPGTMPYSEGIGFIADLRNVTKNDIDQVYYVVAHEMAHQYWAHQLIGPNMQGTEMMSEGFAQYSALMVMEKEYGKDKMKKFLKYEMDGYLSGRGLEFEAERPLIKTEGQAYIHYQKASVVMYYLKEMIGENKVNLALRSLIDTFAYKHPPYLTSLSALRAFKKVTPDSLHYLLDDMFENITLFSNRVLESSYKKVGNEFVVTVKTNSEKYRADSLGKETQIDVKDFIDIGVFAKPESNKNLGKVLAFKRVKLSKKENEFTFKIKEKPYNVGIDPYNYLIDRIPDDNVKITTEN